jgi:Uma2 family endonuclease
MAITEHLISADELFQMPHSGRCELVRGEIITMTPAGSLHGKISACLGAILFKFVEGKKLGVIFGAETGFIIRRDPDSVLAPDVAFVRLERLTAELPQGYFDGPPDLAVEVLSPNDRASEVQRTIRDWLQSGCCAVWIVDPETKTVTIYKSNQEIAVLNPADTLADEQLLPGFTAVVGEIFA